MNSNSKKDLIGHIKKLPKYLGREIFSFLVLDGNLVSFKYPTSYADDTNYSMRYEIAFISNNQLLTNNSFFLSRIYKKNGKHRYYITTITYGAYCDSCGESNCRSDYCGRLIMEEYYSSKYIICSNLDEAVLQFYVMSNR